MLFSSELSQFTGLAQRSGMNQDSGSAAPNPAAMMSSYLDFLSEDLLFGTEALDPATLEAVCAVGAPTGRGRNAGGHQRRDVPIKDSPSDDGSEDEADDDKPSRPARKRSKSDADEAARNKACREKARREKINDK